MVRSPDVAPRHTPRRAPRRAARHAPAQVRLRAWRLPLAACALVGGLALALAATGGMVARADAQPALTVSIKAGGDTQTTYTVVAANFPANQTLTETFGDGTLIAPATGQTDASGGMTRYWTLDVANTYCGTITARSGSAEASVSFWVAPSSDAQSGTACNGGGSGGGGGTANPTPNTTATAAAQATAAATAAPTQTPSAQPTTAPASESGSGGLPQWVLGGRLLLLVGGGALALFVIVVVLVVAAALRKSGKQGPAGGRNGAWNASPSGRQGAQRWRQVSPGAPYGQPHGPHAGAGWPQQAPRTPNRMPGAGRADPRWRIMDEEPHDDQPGVPDQRWSRSQPGARGGHGAAGPGGGGTPARMRTLREFTEHRPGVRPPSRGDDAGWRR